jgi:hypothetical protein
VKAVGLRFAPPSPPNPIGSPDAETLTPRDLLLAGAIAEQVAELLRGEEPRTQLVDAATLAVALGVDRSYVYAHADELGAIRLGDGPKPRLRFDVETAREAFACYASKQSYDSNASARAESAVSAAPRGRRLPNRLPEPGSVLAVRPRGGV